MGIKGIFGEIGSGERVSLAKLAIEKYEQTGRPMRVAIDISIWNFQAQVVKGGPNPALRTIYYRLIRLLSLCVQPLIVFDGPHKPPFKRNKKSTGEGGVLPNFLIKQMLVLLGFPFHTAPGEAEAECALLQREGIVDAVFSEDVDTIMFGCGMTMRNWSSDSTAKGNRSPTHVSVYHLETIKAETRLDRAGMILIALMSGGDYLTEGIPKCGIKLASQAAKAGFGTKLCRLSKSDTAGLLAWRKNLSHEIKTNESKIFSRKSTSLHIPDTFPNGEVMGYYTHPVVSSASNILKLKQHIQWDKDVDVPGLRKFTADAFNWQNRIGAKKFIRSLAPALLVAKLLARGNRRGPDYDDLTLTAINEMELVRSICGRRLHYSTDGVPELRLVYIPNDIVKLDLENEPDDSQDYCRDGLAPYSLDDELEELEETCEVPTQEIIPSTNSSGKPRSFNYNPTEAEKVWVLETVVQVGVPLKAEDYEETLRNPAKAAKAKKTAKKVIGKGGMPRGALDRYTVVTKPNKDSHLSLHPFKASGDEHALPPNNHALSPGKSSPEKKSLPLTRSIRSRREHYSTSHDTQSANSKSITSPSSFKIVESSLSARSAAKTSWAQPQTSRPIYASKAPRILESHMPTGCSRSPKHSWPTTPLSSMQRTNLLLGPSGTVNNLSSPSPKKKRSPVGINQPTQNLGLRSDNRPESTRTCSESAQPNRRLHFTSEISGATGKEVNIPPSPDQDLPALDELFGSSSARKTFNTTPKPVKPKASPSGSEKLCTKFRVIDLSSSSPSLPRSFEEAQTLAGQVEAEAKFDIDIDIQSKDLPGINELGQSRGFVVPRESLDGAWKQLPPGVLQEGIDRIGLAGSRQRRAWRVSEVEVLDLTDE